MDVSRGATHDADGSLAEGTGAYTDRVTVTADSVPVADQATPARQVLGSAPMQRVGSVLGGRSLPRGAGASGRRVNDDFRSDFSVRGVDFAHLGLSIDGIQTRALLHTFEETGDSGSMALLNSDILDRVTLSMGAYPQRLRRSRRERGSMRRCAKGRVPRGDFAAPVSGTNASMLAEGPFGEAASGSWLVSSRYSYIDWLVRRVVPDFDAVFGFADVQSKGSTT